VQHYIGVGNRYGSDAHATSYRNIDMVEREGGERGRETHTERKDIKTSGNNVFLSQQISSSRFFSQPNKAPD
jgi:hypothetical protein